MKVLINHGDAKVETKLLGTQATQRVAAGRCGGGHAARVAAAIFVMRLGLCPHLLK